MILEPKSQNGLQNDQKSIRFFSKSRLAFGHGGIPYKTCRLLSLLGMAKPQIGALPQLEPSCVLKKTNRGLLRFEKT